jgi:hypothetical protein
MDDRKVVIGSDSEGLAGYAEAVGEVMAQDDTGLYICDGHIHELRTTRTGEVKFEQTRLGKIGAIVQDSRRSGRYIVAVDKRGAAKMLPDAVLRLALETFRDIAADEGRIVHVQTRFPLMLCDAKGVWSAFAESVAGVHDGVFIAPDKRYKPVATVASDDDIRRLAGIVMQPFAEFPFADSRHRALTLAAALMACTRTTMRVAPAVIVEAPIPRSGKTLLAETLAMLTPNRDDDRAIATSIPNKEEELEKKLAAFAGGTDAVLFDNLRTGLYSAALESLVTAGTITVRPFGQNDETETRDFRALVLFTGNNAAMSDDLRRRALNIRLDANTQTPQDVVHSFDPREKAAELRGDIAAAAIGILDYVQKFNHNREQWLRDVSPDFADLIAPAVRRACAVMPEAFEWPEKVIDEALGEDSNSATVEAIIAGFADSPHLIEQARQHMTVSEMVNMPPFAIVRDMLAAQQPPKSFGQITLGRFLNRLRDNPSPVGTIRRVAKRTANDTAGWRIDFAEPFLERIIFENECN